MQEETLSGYLAVIPAIVERLDDQLKTMLEEHGCTVVQDGNQFIVSYPPGTIKQQLFPRVRDLHYRLTFPDSFEVREIEAPNRKISVYAVILQNS